MSQNKAMIGILLLALALSGCFQKADLPNDPKSVLTKYISKSFDVKSVEDKKELVGYLTGDAKARLSAWSEDQFREAFMDNKRTFLKLLFTETKPGVNAQQMDITYELSYLDQHEAKVTQKKFAQLIQTDGKWLISDVQNIKELVEYRHEMSLP